MYPLTRPTALLATGAFLLAAAGTAVADTNKSQQTSSVSGPVAAVLSPASARPDNGQASRQLTDKAYTANWSLTDYFGAGAGVGHCKPGMC
ncbi:hypothetical protein [Streptomyces flavidovirens]|uniref:hypothetical protein n=1 Tax=Streptomyces flavidovirens TaxID=67298 RepID=UPI00041FE7EF|nr:hypothetical protein [Streptomyces flavidovirens]